MLAIKATDSLYEGAYSLRRSDRNFTLGFRGGKLGIIALERIQKTGKPSNNISSGWEILKLYLKTSKALLPQNWIFIRICFITGVCQLPTFWFWRLQEVSF